MAAKTKNLLSAYRTEQYGAVRITPLYFGQRKLNQKNYLPILLQLPEELDFTPIPFGWGVYSNANPGLAALENGYLTYQIKNLTWAWALCGGSNDNTGPGGTNSGFLINIYHAHEGSQYQFFNRPAFNQEVLGSGQKPMLMRVPHLFLPGDSLEVEVQNLGQPTGANVTSIHVTIMCGQATHTSLKTEQGK